MTRDIIPSCWRTHLLPTSPIPLASKDRRLNCRAGAASASARRGHLQPRAVNVLTQVDYEAQAMPSYVSSVNLTHWTVEHAIY
jgi:hypothetical protein